MHHDRSGPRSLERDGLPFGNNPADHEPALRQRRRPREPLVVAQRALVAERGTLHGQHAQVELLHATRERLAVRERLQLHEGLMLEGAGRAVLCFPGHGDWFQGYVVLEEGQEHVGLLGVELPVDDCVRCPDGGYREFRLTLMPFDLHQQEADVVVAKTGGDVCRLQSDHVTFETDVMLSEQKAVDAIHKYFPTIAARAEDNPDVLQDCLVCIGTMKIMEIELQRRQADAATA